MVFFLFLVLVWFCSGSTLLSQKCALQHIRFVCEEFFWCVFKLYNIFWKLLNLLTLFIKYNYNNFYNYILYFIFYILYFNSIFLKKWILRIKIIFIIMVFFFIITIISSKSCHIIIFTFNFTIYKNIIHKIIHIYTFTCSCVALR